MNPEDILNDLERYPGRIRPKVGDGPVVDAAVQAAVREQFPVSRYEVCRVEIPRVVRRMVVSSDAAVPVGISIVRNGVGIGTIVVPSYGCVAFDSSVGVQAGDLLIVCCDQPQKAGSAKVTVFTE